jgi:hypothetical protein
VDRPRSINHARVATLSLTPARNVHAYDCTTVASRWFSLRLDVSYIFRSAMVYQMYRSSALNWQAAFPSVLFQAILYIIGYMHLICNFYHLAEVNSCIPIVLSSSQNREGLWTRALRCLGLSCAASLRVSPKLPVRANLSRDLRDSPHAP